jgi:hypothetical protein
MAAEVQILGVRHHGPGSARTLLRALAEFQPDAVLIEGPPDADGLIPLAADGDMLPPVALLVYESASPSNASFYPFARFSPEWQALRFALGRGIGVGFMDLAAAHRFAMERPAEPDGEASEPADPEPEDAGALPLARDPLGALARAAGFDDGERWWEHMFEHRRSEGSDALQVFGAVREAMAALRESAAPGAPGTHDHLEPYREASMRKIIRAAARAHGRVAVVCGAWHAPVLERMPPAAEDNALLKGLPKARVDATWIPWTHRRLSASSGYGAGVRSPGWYDHLWAHEDAIAERWLTRAARLLRGEDLDASSAHVIESSRLAYALAAMRDRAIPGLDELTEASEAVLCAGDPTPLALIHDRLVVGDLLGAVPDAAPSTPLQQDLQQTAKRLRLAMSAEEKDLDLDLRKETDLARSHLLHRLSLLGIPWGVRGESRSRTSSFHERWRLRWLPEFAVRVIEAGAWGNTVLDASLGKVRDRAAGAASIVDLTGLIEDAMLADLPGAAEALVTAIADRAAVDTDVAHLLGAFPPLARVARYGGVRPTDAESVYRLLVGLAARFCVGLPPACRSLSEEAAGAMLPLIGAAHSALALVADRVDQASWHEALGRVALDDRAAPALGGKACRLLLDAGVLDPRDAGVRLSVTLSRAAQPGAAASWVEGFLAGSGLVLVHDDRLFAILDAWVASLAPEHFLEVLPLLRRTFSTFVPGERRMLGERFRRAAPSTGADRPALGIDPERGARALGVVGTILGLTPAVPGQGAAP